MWLFMKRAGNACSFFIDRIHAFPYGQTWTMTTDIHIYISHKEETFHAKETGMDDGSARAMAPDGGQGALGTAAGNDGRDR